MPPLNQYAFDDPFYVKRTSLHDVRSSSSFERELHRKAGTTTKSAYPSRRPKKSVSFNNRAQVEYLPTRNEWTEDEKVSRWYSSDDYSRYQLDILNTVYRLRNDPLSMDDVCHCSRGVECRDPIATKRRRQIKREAWGAVFERQRVQRQIRDEIEGYNYLVASMYHNAAQYSMRLALDVGAQDEMDADRIRKEDDRSQQVEMDLFDISWISTSASSMSEKSSFAKTLQCSSSETDYSDNNFSGFAVFGGNQGFDNSWLRAEF
mmetsp:Transcript_35926/g.75380  ORF Transcript_35926/g.75380 Transcript_35926/m.75380 type:complete len:262 (-) Transcript_35926:135-920(-)|eukprot:CAMPEP_0201202494 /NCGR_PEP_ID=MMETSP0851-20130426/165097_1 /ASSEMBLY_ACC=CAM_ASM_000631 /TAXON_ID=183588 /ORGANISM="Pseudo-nitzschia fraudulenta, Strain WWA7" /LENGTH=261 /DNA_ID=CAMNT_0047490351 /DNA_START=60 /DNA_END=845 /DNA_ORIENTATION=+